MSWFWQTICSQTEISIMTNCSTNESTNCDINDCFLYLVINCPIFIFLTVFSSYYLGFQSNIERDRNRFNINSNIWYKRLLYIRILIISIIFLITLTDLVVIAINSQQILSFYISVTLKLISLIIYLIYLITKNFVITKNCIRESICLNITIVLIIIINIIELCTIFVKHNYSTIHLSFELIVVVLWVGYGLTLIPKAKLELNSENQLFINYLENSYDHENSSQTLLVDNRLKCDEDVNFVSKIFLWWVQPLLTKGITGNIESHEHLFRVPNNITSKHVNHKFNSYFEINGNTTNESLIVKRQTLLKTLCRCYGFELFMVGLLKFGSDSLSFGGPILLNKLVLYLEEKDRSYDGFYYAFGLFSCTIISSIFISLFNFYINNVTLKIRCAIITSLYRKIFSVGSDTLNSNFSTGEILNFANTDTDRITNFCPSLLQFISLPIQLIVTLYLLYTQLGLAFLSGLVFAIILIPINRFICKKIGSLSASMMEWKDKRIKLMTEILMGIRVIKMYAWEDLFESRINFFRQQEVKYLKGRKYLDAFCVYFWATTPVLISSLVFGTYILMGGSLTAAKVFTSLALLGMLIMPLNAFPWVLNGLMEAWISMKRLQRFYDLHEMQLKKHYNVSITENNNKIEAYGASFKRIDSVSTDNLGRYTLGPIDMILEDNMFIGVFGKVGSGKSSLLSAFVGEMMRISGKLALNENDMKSGIAIVTQEPWIQNATVKDNILFGKPFILQKYNEILEACALVDDIKTFSNGDMTLIGDRGVTLSGGQKSRIALARAIYQDFNLYLIDDPFASLDIHIAEHIYSKCILGLLDKKAKIICTNHTKYLSESDVILVMDCGQIIAKGAPKTILKKYENQELYENTNIEDNNIKTDLDIDTDITELSNFKEEEREEGVVKFYVYVSYFKAVGIYLSLLILFSILLMQMSRSASDVWLSIWTSNNNFQLKNNPNSYQYYLIVFGSITIANSIFTLFRAFLFAYGGIVAALKIHCQLFTKLLSASIKFFDLTPFGRIINRFSSDIVNVDDALPFTLNIFLAQIYSLLASFVITIYGLPWIAALIIPLLIPYYFIQHYYRYTSRELKRLCAITLSPIYAQLDETLQGLIIIRTFSNANRFINNLFDKIDINVSTQYAMCAIQQWLNLRLQFLGVIISSGVAILAVSLHIYSYQTMDAGLVGLALVYSLSVTALLNGSVQSFAQTEMDMVSVERVMQYINEIESEDSSVIISDNMLENWPNKGVVCFDNVSMRYRSGTNLALNNVSFDAKSGEHIGIVGRTGSGKSSLFQALFRLTNIESGKIYIDGIDITHISLHHLRSNIFIIPQEPFLFSGTIRENVDPRSQHSDSELWHLLKECQLESLILSIGGLNAKISERGRDISVGQKQLLCLVRAMLSKTKILCLDEATASIDQSTENIIQQALRKFFNASTVISIAHKIECVLNCDRIIVMDNGTISEMGTPDRLMQNTNSLFYKLCH